MGHRRTSGRVCQVSELAFLQVMELFFAVHHLLGTQEAELLPPLGLLLHVGDILQLSGCGGGMIGGGAGGW